MKRFNLRMATAVLVVVMAGVASASPQPGWYRAYYDEQGTQVGARGWDCDLQSISWGVITDRYYTTNICLE